MTIRAAKIVPRPAAVPPGGQDIEIRTDTRENANPQPGELIELLQVSHARLDSAHYTLYEERFLAVHRKRPFRKAQRYWLDLGFLDPTPHLLTIIDRPWLHASLALSLATAGLLVATALSPDPWQQQAWLPATLALFAASLLALAVFFQRSRSLVRFHSRHGDAVFLEMSSNLPSRDEFREFMRTLVHAIHAAHRSDPAKPYRKLGAELVEHRRLAEAGVLGRDAYDHAREKILRRHRQATAQPVARPVARSGPVSRAVGEADIIEITLAEGVRPGDVTTVELFEK